eukprot:TRINITY_DN1329_c0_g1_i6.p2 TRINITY_DN1329_c0_g1~~TRINITY_DN1329_c0_g1_i6.p2  ORF type:complete len:191 (+),score=14.59 TRINITY_DN1329_c0_g1_i6:1079-1651(+)
MNKVGLISMILSSVIYVTVGFFGYVTFPNTGPTSGNVLLSLDDSAISTVIRAIFTVAIMFHYPVVHFSFRQVIEKVLFKNYEFSWIRHTIQTIIVLSLTLSVALVLPSLTAVFGITGSLAAFPICYILPAIAYIKLVILDSHPVTIRLLKEHWKPLVLPVSIAVVMTVLMIMNIYSSVKDAIATFSKPSG